MWCTALYSLKRQESLLGLLYSWSGTMIKSNRDESSSRIVSPPTQHSTSDHIIQSTSPSSQQSQTGIRDAVFIRDLFQEPFQYIS